MKRANFEKREVLRCYIERLERELFPFQESEEEQESFTPEGRKRAERVLGEMYDDVTARQVGQKEQG